MKSVAILSLLVLAITEARPEFYDLNQVQTKQEMDLLMANREVMSSFINCFLDKAPCHSLSFEVKKVLGDAIEYKCGRCSPIQRYSGKLFFEVTEKMFPKEHEELKKKYDPEQKYFENFLKAVADANGEN